MPTPKKRKRTGDVASPRRLEYFFARQREVAVVDTRETDTIPLADTNDETDKGNHVSGMDTPQLTGALDDDVAQMRADEELARRLQAEWDAEGVVADVQAATEAVPVPVPETDTSLPVPPVPTVPPAPALTDPDTLPVTMSLPLDTPPLAFAPDAYLPALRREWAASSPSSGEVSAPAPYALLTRIFALVAATHSRTRIVDTLTNGLRVLVAADPASLREALSLTADDAPEGALGLGGGAISKAVRAASGLGGAAAAALFARHGDAGDVAGAVWKRQKTLVPVRANTIGGVYATLGKIAVCAGTGAAAAKQRLVLGLLQAARSADESRFLVRTLSGQLRIGAVQATVLVGVARAFALRTPVTPAAAKERFVKAELAVRSSFAQRPRFADLAAALLATDPGEDPAAWPLPAFCLHTPLHPMLGLPTRDLAAVLAKMQGRGAFACEAKYDGQRAQVHWERQGDGDGDVVTMWSRHLERMTQFPEVAALLPQVARPTVQSCVLEGEVVAVDGATGALRPFQVLAGRTKQGAATGAPVDVCFFVFDLLFLNGEPLLDRPLRERRSLLRTHFTPAPGFAWVASVDVDTADAEAAEALSSFFEEVTALGCEGIMVKVLDASKEKDASTVKTPSTSVKDPPPPPPPSSSSSTAAYEPSRRSAAWLKVKKDYAAAADTLDLVPVAAWRGMGRKAAWWSPVLLAVRDEATGALEAVAKCMSGFSDAYYRQMRAFYSEGGEHTRHTQPPFVIYEGPPPHTWFDPCEVWETAFADITVSPTYVAARGRVHPERGLSLRFPRFVRVRADKGVAEASTSGELAALYRGQAKGGVGGEYGEYGDLVEVDMEEEVVEEEDDDEEDEEDDKKDDDI